MRFVHQLQGTVAQLKFWWISIVPFMLILSLVALHVLGPTFLAHIMSIYAVMFGLCEMSSLLGYALLACFALGSMPFIKTLHLRVSQALDRDSLRNAREYKLCT